jgi:hypothetical protein
VEDEDDRKWRELCEAKSKELKAKVAAANAAKAKKGSRG